MNTTKEPPMPEYQLEIKQIVNYPRCRVYRQFIRTLMEDQSIRTSGGSGLFYFTVLNSYANFRTSHRKIDGLSYTIYPGEWICSISELTKWFRVKFQHQAFAILKQLSDRNLINYTTLGRGKIIKYKIKGWRHHNTMLDYNAPCQKDIGFFFMPIGVSTQIISADKCSEMDCILDLWMNTIYNDEQVEGSHIGPVVYLRNGTGNPIVSYADLAERWGISKATVGRLLKRMEKLEYISLLTFPGNKGSVIYLQSYLSTMFQISDVMIDKDEVAMTLKIKITPPNEENIQDTTDDNDSTSSVSNDDSSVSKTAMDYVVEKVSQILSTQGFECFHCPHSTHKLYLLSDCREDILDMHLVKKTVNKNKHRYELVILCKSTHEVFKFELTLSQSSDQNTGGF